MRPRVRRREQARALKRHNGCTVASLEHDPFVATIMTGGYYLLRHMLDSHSPDVTFDRHSCGSWVCQLVGHNIVCWLCGGDFLSFAALDLTPGRADFEVLAQGSSREHL